MTDSQEGTIRHGGYGLLYQPAPRRHAQIAVVFDSPQPANVQTDLARALGGDVTIHPHTNPDWRTGELDKLVIFGRIKPAKLRQRVISALEAILNGKAVGRCYRITSQHTGIHPHYLIDFSHPLTPRQARLVTARLRERRGIADVAAEGPMIMVTTDPNHPESVARGQITAVVDRTTDMRLVDSQLEFDPEHPAG